jgi:hypothetical protein
MSEIITGRRLRLVAAKLDRSFKLAFTLWFQLFVASREHRA